MKQFLLILSFIITALTAGAQQVSQLPTGKYETVVKTSQNKWERGDIILIDESHYRISTSSETGEYKFSVAAQRVFFTSGPLKNLFARTAISDNAPTIVLPAEENIQSGMRAEVWCHHRQ